jgi:hypothetical protein
MKCFQFCFFADHKTHAGEFWSSSRHYVEQMILSIHPDATEIHIWN